MKKKLVACISFLILIIVVFSLISIFRTDKVVTTNKMQIVATLFPQYDFAKHIVGDKAEVSLLINSGVETHNYEPTPQDMILINNCDMFLYTGTMLEPWTESIVDSIEDESKLCDISENIELIKIEEFEEKHINSSIKYDEESEEDEEIYDEHIWLNPLNAVKMIDNIADFICSLDPENAEYYKENAEEYKNQILEVDTEIEEIVKSSEKNEIAIAGEFAYAYFIDRYNLDFITVYENCGEGEDPSITKVKSVIDYINANDMKIVFYEELSEGTIAKMIAEETTAKSMILYSIHNGDTEKDTYVSLLKKNAEALKEALN